MNAHTLNDTALRALKRTDIQKLAKREGIRATGKKDDMIAALMAKWPGGVEPLEKEQGPARRSKRHNGTQVKEEKSEIEDGLEPAVYGDSISQYIPARPRNKNKVATEDGMAVPLTHFTTPPLTSSSPPPSSRPATKGPAPQGSLRGVRTAHNSQTVRPEPAPEFVQGSSRPVEQPAPAWLHEQERLTIGVPVSAAAPTPVIPRVREGVSKTTQEFLELIDERGIRLLPTRQATINRSPPLVTAQTDNVGVAQPDSQIAEPPPLSLTPPRSLHTAIPTTAAFHFHPIPAEPRLCPRPLRDSPTPHQQVLLPRLPVFTRPSLPPANPEAGPSRRLTEAGRRRVPMPPWLAKPGPSKITSYDPLLPVERHPEHLAIHENKENQEGEEDEDNKDLLDPTYDLIPSSPECNDDDERTEDCYFAMLKRFAGSDFESDSDPGSECDEEDQRMAALEAMAKAQQEKAGSDPAGSQPVKGATGSQARKVVFDARRMAEEMHGVRVKRKGMAREFAFLKAQEDVLEGLKLELHAKRLALEETVITKLKRADNGWLNGLWVPPAKEFRRMKSHAFAEKYQPHMSTMQEEGADWEDSQEVVEVMEVAEELDGLDNFFEDDELDELDVLALGPAFQYRPVITRRHSGSSSSLPPSSLLNSEPFTATLPTFRPEPVTPPRRAQRGAPAPTQDSDSFERSSSKSSGNATRPKVSHPAEAVDRAVRGTQIEPSQQAGVPRTSLTGLYANPVPVYGVAAPWYSRRTYEEVGLSVSYLGRKRRQDEGEDLDENGAGPSVHTTTEEDWASGTEENGSTSRPADPQTGYVPKPVVGYNGTAGHPHADWRNLLGGRGSPSPPKRLRREGW